ncbi:MAG: YbaK/EbsC family protein [Tissierellia bacterium]|nr:YbaK/EbsC family protein [Tissierellia bacterium]
MSIERARKYFSEMGIEDRVREFEVSSATVEKAAEAVGCEPMRIAKSLSFMIKGVPTIVVVAGEARIDNRKFKDEFLAKAKMIDPNELEELVGHEMGGICPFGIKDGVDVFLDISLKLFETVFPACGSDNSAIELSIEEMEKYSNYIKWVDVCKNWE